MIPGLAIKVVATAVVVIIVTVSVARLGPRIGGILVGTPIVVGPAFFFLGREQTTAFVTEAAISTLHALAASLLFLMSYVIVATRLPAIASLSVAVIAWAVAAALFIQIPDGLLPALGAYAIVFAAALALERQLRLPPTRAAGAVRWGDLLIRGIAAGTLVGFATTVAAQFGPTLSGVLAGFPVGFVVVSVTLHQRFGAPVTRATLVTAQRGMLSLVAFTATIAVLTPLVGAVTAFLPALVVSLSVSALLAGSTWLMNKAPFPRPHDSS